MKEERDQPSAGTLPLLQHHCHHNRDHHGNGEPPYTVADGTLQGLEDVVLAGVAPVGGRAHTGGLSVDLHAAAVAAAAPPAAFLRPQLQQLCAVVEGGVQARDLREDGGGGGRGRGAEGARNEAAAPRQLLPDDTWASREQT